MIILYMFNFKSFFFFDSGRESSRDLRLNDKIVFLLMIAMLLMIMMLLTHFLYLIQMNEVDLV